MATHLGEVQHKFFEHNLGLADAHRHRIPSHQMDHRVVCRIDVPASSRPIWVKAKSAADVRYQLRNNSTRPVPPAEIELFISERFGSQHAELPGI